MNQRSLHLRRAVGALALAGTILAACGPAAGPNSSGAATSNSPTGAAGSTPDSTPAPLVPLATDAGGVPATIIPLGIGAAPIDVAYAFGSIWVSNHHFNSVTRLNPDTYAEEAIIEGIDGPGWFVASDDALWVSNQLRRGLTRIDPVTNASADEATGFWGPCWAPVLAFGSIWQASCDAHVIMRIDPKTSMAVDITTVDYAEGVVLVGDQLLAVGPKGLAKVDPSTNKLIPVGGCCGRIVGADDKTVWLADEQQIYRVDPATGARVSTVPITFAGTMRTYGDHAWLIQESTAALKINLATDAIEQTLPVRPEPLSVIEAAGAVWVTSFGGDALWRLDP
jgi:streptogramin lyase